MAGLGLGSLMISPPLEVLHNRCHKTREETCARNPNVLVPANENTPENPRDKVNVVNTTHKRCELIKLGAAYVSAARLTQITHRTELTLMVEKLHSRIYFLV